MNTIKEFQLSIDKNLSSINTLIESFDNLPEKGKTKKLGKKIAFLLQMNISFNDLVTAQSACEILRHNYFKALQIFPDGSNNALNYKTKLEQLQNIQTFITNNVLPTRQSLDEKINTPLVLTNELEQQIAIGNFSKIEELLDKSKLQKLRNEQFLYSEENTPEVSAVETDEESAHTIDSNTINNNEKNHALELFSNLFKDYFPNKLTLLDAKKIKQILDSNFHNKHYTENQIIQAISFCTAKNIFEGIAGFGTCEVKITNGNKTSCSVPFFQPVDTLKITHIRENIEIENYVKKLQKFVDICLEITIFCEDTLNINQDNLQLKKISKKMEKASDMLVILTNNMKHNNTNAL